MEQGALKVVAAVEGMMRLRICSEIDGLVLKFLNKDRMLEFGGTGMRGQESDGDEVNKQCDEDLTMNNDNDGMP